MKINYRPADAESELRPLAETFLRHYELKKLTKNSFRVDYFFQFCISIILPSGSVV